jgi:hypothetical protein
MSIIVILYLAIIFGMIKNTKNKTRINYYLTINNNQ